MTEFKHVPDEVERMRETGIFDISYTHATAHTTRWGVEQTGKLMAPRIAIANGIVPFLGEPEVGTYLFRAYHVSVSRYDVTGADDHHWQRYIAHGMFHWTPKQSQELIEYLKAEKKKMLDEPYCLSDHVNPGRKTEIGLKFDGCIELEELKQERFAELSDEERYEIQNPRSEIYVFGRELGSLLSQSVAFGELVHAEHPFAPCEINLKRYGLKGMFTSLDVGETREWISGVVERDIPVASIDVLATYEEMMGK